jgi:predicted phosphodiesterase
MKIKIISDTHQQHQGLLIEKDLDSIIHCGDSTNYYNLQYNQIEFDIFIKWYSELPIKNKILIAGNHDAWSIKRYNVDKVKDLGITYLEHEYYELNNLLIFGSPYTPTRGKWYHMKDRSKLDRVWQALEPDIDILITHGPPKTMLDLNHNRDGKLEYCGDGALLKHVLIKKPKYHCFGHTHNSEGCFNQGIRIFEDTTFINASCVTNGKIGQGVSSQGIIINI